MSKRIHFLLGLLVGCLLLAPLGSQAKEAWKIVFNGAPSTVKTVTVGEEGKVIPLHFPVPEEGRKAEYGVKIETDPINMEIRVTRVLKKRRTRDVGDCPSCTGSKSCQECYPPGSGLNVTEAPCYLCNGSGSCYTCSGSGKCYVCYGNGFQGGCNTCGKDSSNS